MSGIDRITSDNLKRQMLEPDEDEEKKKQMHLERLGLAPGAPLTDVELQKLKDRQPSEVDAANKVTQTQQPQDHMAHDRGDDDQKAQAIAATAGAGVQGGQTAHAVSPAERLNEVKGLDDSEAVAKKTKGWA